MKLPNYEQAFLPREKIADYLLSDSHPRGRTKAAFFKRFGFTQENWQLLAKALTEHAANYDAVLVDPTEFGLCYDIYDELTTPSGRTPTILSAWVFDTGSETPRFISAFPR